MRILSGLVLAIVAAHPAWANLYECRFQGENSWVPEVVVVEAGKQGDDVAVFDPLIKYFLKAPTKARVEADNSRRTTFTWDYRVKNASNQHARMTFRMTRLKGDSSASISVRALGFVGPFAGHGSCKTVPGKL